MSKRENTKRTLYILTEGHTEHAYFSRIGEIMGDADDWSYSVTVEVREIVNGSKTDPFNMVKEAKRNLRNYNEVWVVFDKDRERAAENFKAFELAQKFKIQIAFSSISFEQWVLVHFERGMKAFERSDCESRGILCTCEGEICALTYIKKNYYPGYVKGSAKLYDELLDKQSVALEYAAWLKYQNGTNPDFLSMNPYTDVDKLVAYLLDLPTILFVALNSAFNFDDLEFCITNLLRGNQELKVSVSVINNSNKAWIFNHNQKNILLLDKGGKEINYSIHASEICSPGESKMIEIAFAIDENFVAERLKFISLKEIVYIEL